MPDTFNAMKRFFEKDVCKRACAPLKNGVTLFLEVSGEAFTASKKNGAMVVTEGKPEDPGMSFFVPQAAFETLSAAPTEDIGEMGILLLQRVVSTDVTTKVKVKVHLGPLELWMQGYLGVLPLGGPTVMKFLANKGFSSLSKIKETLNKMRH